jgi:hypothetical protein
MGPLRRSRSAALPERPGGRHVVRVERCRLRVLPGATREVAGRRHYAEPEPVRGFGESIRTNGWGFDTALDFSKYLPPTDNGLRSHLKTYYRIDWSKTGFGGFDHALMASFEVDF